MSAKDLSDKLSNHEVIIYAETANEIFQRCFLNAGIDAGRNWPNMLIKAIHLSFPESQMDNSYLRNKYNHIKKALAKGDKEKITFYHSYLYVLSRFAGIDDYYDFNENFRKLEFTVMYVSAPFRLFNFIRIGDEGVIVKAADNWFFFGEEGLSITGIAKSIAVYTMPGDKNPFWIKLCYTVDSQEKVAYFAEMQDRNLTIQSPSSPLVEFLSKFL